MRLGVCFRPQSPPEDLRAVVEAVDASTVDELWLWEDCFLEGGLTTATAALAWSSRVHVGIGLLPVPLRNPALTAMEVATIARLFPGRFTVTLGHGVQDWMAQVGERRESPMTLLREHVAAVRALLAGDEVDVDGRYVHLDRVRLDWPPAEPPRLLVGARGPRTIRLAGELADGVLLDDVADREAVRAAVHELARAREEVASGHRAEVSVFTEVDPALEVAALDAAVTDQVETLTSGGADTVILHGTSEHPDPAPLVGALERYCR